MSTPVCKVMVKDSVCVCAYIVKIPAETEWTQDLDLHTIALMIKTPHASKIFEDQGDC